MIKKFGVRNFSSIKSGIEINFEFDGHVPEAISQNQAVTSVLGIKGGNGSGKTNIMKALSFLKYFCSTSADSEMSNSIPFKTFSNNSEPTEFYIDFEVNGDKYSYELELTTERVLREEFFRTRERKTVILKRQGDIIEQAVAELKELESVQLRSDASIISLYTKYRFKSSMPDMVNIWEFFRGMITNVNNAGYVEVNFEPQLLSKMYLNDDMLFGFIKDVVKIADESVKDIEIKEAQNEKGEKIYFPVFCHENVSGNFYLSLAEESSGTRRLFQRMVFYWLTLKAGGLLIMDEFDIHLHSMVLPKILALFLDPNINRKGAQFVFTSHNTEIIDHLGKYRTILVNKEEGETYCYRLDEIPGSMIRNDRTIIPIYLSGKIGGVPSNLADSEKV